MRGLYTNLSLNEDFGNPDKQSESWLLKVDYSAGCF